MESLKQAYKIKWLISNRRNKAMNLTQRLVCGHCGETFVPNVYTEELKAGDYCPECSDPEPNPSNSAKLRVWDSEIYVNVYLLDQAFGGREEGGWYFTTGEPVESRICDSWVEACEVFTKLESKYCGLNEEDRRDMYSVLSRGEYGVMIENHFACPFPECKPHYE
jgi:hypothetical protein